MPVVAGIESDHLNSTFVSGYGRRLTEEANRHGHEHGARNLRQSHTTRQPEVDILDFQGLG